MSLPEDFTERKHLDRARDIFTHQLRTAVSKARLAADALQNISVQLRHKNIDVEQAIEAIREQGLSEYLPKGGAS
jgi:hypothetical protein